MPTPKPTPRRRVQDWPTLLFHFIETRRARPFEWGRQDCCLFACDGILSQTGLDPAAAMYRGKYHDALGAARLLKKHGGVEVIAAKVCADHGWPEVVPALAQRGDVLLRDTPNESGPMLGLSVGDGVMFPGPDGLIKFPVAGCRRAWRVG